MKNILRLLSVILVLVALVGCKKEDPAAAVETGAETGPGMPRGGMDPTNELALGTFKLEGSDNAVTAEQAGKLLPLWTIIQGGSLQGTAETQAVLDQIKAQMTGDQLAAIEAMDLTFEDVRAWMEDQGIEMPALPEEGGMPGGGGMFGDMTEEERQKMREEFQSMTQEERATRMAEMGFERPEGGVPGGGQGGRQGGQGTRPGGGARGGGLISPLIDLLTERAG